MQTLTSPIPTVPEFRFLGTRCRILADSESTAGRYGLVDMVEVPAGNMPPLHVHHTHDEGFLLLEGELTLVLPDREIALEPGQFVLAPRGVPHVYRVGDSPARDSSFCRRRPGSNSSCETSLTATRSPPSRSRHSGPRVTSRSSVLRAPCRRPESSKGRLPYGSRPCQRVDPAAASSSIARPPIANAAVTSRLRVTLPSWCPSCL